MYIHQYTTVYWTHLSFRKMELEPRSFPFQTTFFHFFNFSFGHRTPFWNILHWRKGKNKNCFGWSTGLREGLESHLPSPTSSPGGLWGAHTEAVTIRSPADSRLWTEEAQELVGCKEVRVLRRREADEGAGAHRGLCQRPLTRFLAAGRHTYSVDDQRQVLLKG